MEKPSKIGFRKTALTPLGKFKPARRDAVAGVGVIGKKPIKKDVK